MALNENQAVALALRAASRLGVAQGFQPRAVERRIIEIAMDGQPVMDRLPGPGPVRDVAAYLVTLGLDASEVEMAIDASNGDVVRFRRSRA